MKRIVLFLSIALTGMGFVPVFTVIVVPEWELKLIGENGKFVANARVDQSWKDYSLEFFRETRHLDETRSSDENGIVRFPERAIQVSAWQTLAARIRDIFVRIDPHASYGPSSHVFCRGDLSCDTSYSPKEPIPISVVVKR